MGAHDSKEDRMPTRRQRNLSQRYRRNQAPLYRVSR